MESISSALTSLFCKHQLLTGVRQKYCFCNKSPNNLSWQLLHTPTMPGGPAELQLVAPSQVPGANVPILGLQKEGVGGRCSFVERVAICCSQKLEVTTQTVQPHHHSAAGFLQIWARFH